MCTSEALSRAARDDHWRRTMNRSVSVDAVHTNTRGHVRSNAWKQAEKYRKNSTHSERKKNALIFRRKFGLHRTQVCDRVMNTF